VSFLNTLLKEFKSVKLVSRPGNISENRRDDYGTVFLQPSDEAKTVLSSMTQEERVNFNDLLRRLQEWHESGAATRPLHFHPEARASLWGAALAKIADHYREIERNERAFFFMMAAWNLSKYPIFAYNAALLSLSVDAEDVFRARTLLQAYLAEYQKVLTSPNLKLVSPEMTERELEDIAKSARVRLAALQSVENARSGNSDSLDEDDEDAAGYRAFHRIPTQPPRQSVSESTTDTPTSDNSTRGDKAAVNTDKNPIIGEEEVRQIGKIVEKIAVAFSAEQFTRLFKHEQLCEGWTVDDALAVWYSLGHVAFVVAIWQSYKDRNKAYDMIDGCRYGLEMRWRLSDSLAKKVRAVVNETQGAAVKGFGNCKSGSDLSLFFHRYVSRILGAPIPFDGNSEIADMLSGLRYRGNDPVLIATVCDLFVKVRTSVKQELSGNLDAGRVDDAVLDD
jgi:hypothetical protein